MRYLEAIVDHKYSFFNPVQFGYEDCAPSWAYGPKVRSFWLLHYVVSGQGVFTRDGLTHKVKAGEVFVIPPYVETYYQADARDPWYYIWIGFTAQCIPGDVLSKPVISRPGMGQIFQDMRKSQELEGGKSAFLCSKIWELVSLLLENSSHAPSHVEKALSFIHTEYANPITVASIAEHLDLDRCYFSSLFKSKTGISPIEYLSKLRLEKAADLISKHEISPSVACLSVGFSDYCHFSKSFKKKYGISPKFFKG